MVLLITAKRKVAIQYTKMQHSKHVQPHKIQKSIIIRLLEEQENTNGLFTLIEQIFFYWNKWTTDTRVTVSMFSTVKRQNWVKRRNIHNQMLNDEVKLK